MRNDFIDIVYIVVSIWLFMGMVRRSIYIVAYPFGKEADKVIEVN